MQTVKCIHCGHEFPSPIDIAYSTNLVISSRTDCPNCLELTPIMPFPEKAYDFDENGVASLLSGPEFTPKVLSKLKKLTEQTIAAPETVTQFPEAVEAIAPGLWKKLDTFIGDHKNILAFLVFLVAIINGLPNIIKLVSPPAPSTIINNYYVAPPTLLAKESVLGKTQPRPPATIHLNPVSKKWQKGKARKKGNK